MGPPTIHGQPHAEEAASSNDRLSRITRIGRGPVSARLDRELVRSPEFCAESARRRQGQSFVARTFPVTLPASLSASESLQDAE